MGQIEFTKFRELALELGFSDLAFSEIGLVEKHISAYKEWIDEKFQAEMTYMEKSEAREKMDFILKDASSVITLVTNYYYKRSNTPKHSAKVARYAYGRDYHKIITKRLKILESFLKQNFEGAECRFYIDTGPILERAYAEKSGLGFIGKNSCLITKNFGSFVFISEIITTIALPENFKARFDTDKKFSVCGSCNLCMEACPTKAIKKPGQIDANKCISYLTIENKGEIKDEFKDKIKESGYIFGCDICQEVCPHNVFANETNDPEFKNKIAGEHLNIKEILDIEDDEEFLDKFKGSPLMRAKRKGLQRNARIFRD